MMYISSAEQGWTGLSLAELQRTGSAAYLDRKGLHNVPVLVKVHLQNDNVWVVIAHLT